MSIPFWTDEMRRKAAKMWAAGVSTGAMAAAFETNRGTVCSMLSRHREQFPARREAVRPRPQNEEIIQSPSGDKDRVIRITISGAKVTLPRVPTIDGPASADSGTMFTDLSDTGQRNLL